MNQFVLYFNFSDKVWEYVLPAQDNRSISVNLGAVLQLENSDLSCEVWNGKWHIMSNEDIGIYIKNEQVEDYIIKNGDIISGKIFAYATSFTILVVELDIERINYEKYSLSDVELLTFGSGQNCNIRIENNYVSKLHATIKRIGSKAVITDNSTNGIYVNGKRITGSCQLCFFDEIYIVGVKMVFLGEILAINQSSCIHTDLQKLNISSLTLQQTRTVIDEPFSPSPRIIEPLNAEPLEIEAPPAPQRNKKQPMIFTLGPMFTMPLPILATVLFNASRNANGTSDSFMYFGSLIAIVLSALIGACWALARHLYDQKSRKEDEELRVNAYQAYIQDNQKLLESCHNKVRNILNVQYESTTDLLSHLENNTAVLWNRNVNNNDFLTIRLGKGLVTFPGVITIPQKRFSVYKDSLAEKPYELYERYKYLHDGVSCISLKKYKIIGMIGNDVKMKNVVRNIVLQTSFLHSYTDVKVVFLTNNDDEELSWIKWLPHTFTSDKKLRMISNDNTTRQNVLYQLTEELRLRDNAIKDGGVKFLPHYLVVCMSPDLLNNEGIYKYVTNETDYGFTFLLPYGKLDQLPNECKSIIECSDDFTGHYLLTESRKSTDEIKFDMISLEEAESLAKKISGFYVKEIATGEIPATIDFMEMYGLANVEQWNLIRHWRENRTYESIRALIGIKSGGKPMYLDIHEKRHGPHGLVAGTTGSGKSETLQTYILSLAMNYHPDELAVILIDYKGGGMANVFQNLVHVAGTITNLGGSQTRRALISIKSENRRRQSIFERYNVNHIDQYARLYREGKAKEPLPHLIIISDEFAELKKEQPEFIRELVSTARVGRSLGIHLILATQKPSGVVDDEIWSNSRFKLCLHVQDKQDSNEMLHRPDAAYLTNTGRGYLQIGNDELFEQFQSGYSGAEYVPSEETVSLRDTEIVMIGIDGTNAVAKGKKKLKKSDSVSQLAAMVSCISKTAEENGIKQARQLWLPELPERIVLEDLIEKYTAPQATGLKAVFGLVDNPVNQEQHLAVLDFERISNLMIIGLPGTGKSTLLQTIIYSMTTQYSPEQLNYYILDFSGNLLNVFENAPHCGGVILFGDEERVKRLLTLLAEIMKERSEIFQQVHVGSLSEYQRVGQSALPKIFVFLDNYIAFSEQYEAYEESLSKLARDGLKYGIHIVVTLNHMNDMKFRLRQNFTTMLPLTLSERSDYGEALGNMPEYTPASICGRGLLLDEEILEFQVALPVQGYTEKERGEYIIKQVCKTGNNYLARRIPVIPENETFREILDKAPSSIIPVGYNQETIEIAGFDKEDSYCIAISGNDIGVCEQQFLNIIDYTRMNEMKLYLIQLDYHLGRMFRNCSADIRVSNADEVYNLLIYLRQEFKSRSDARKNFMAQQTEESWESWRHDNFTDIMIVIDNMSEFSEIIYGGKPADMSAIMECFFKQGQGLGIYFVAGFGVSVNDKAIYTTLVKNFLKYKTGIHFGGYLDQQKVLNVNLSLREQSKPMDENYGYLVSDNTQYAVFIPKSTDESI